jgi:hypothetical protein
MKIKNVILFFALSFAQWHPSPARQELSAAWPTRAYTHQADGFVYPDFEPALNFSNDIIITGISFRIANIPKGAVVDWGINLARNTPPLMPHVTAVNSEIIGLHSSWHGSGGTWQGNIDLTKTPLYMPANTDMNCFAPIFLTTLPSAATLECSISYHLYTYPEPRYRSIRFPYTDMPNLPSGKLAKSWYKSGDAYNLIVGGWIAFTSFGGANSAASANNICMRTSATVNGTLIKKVCYADQIISKNVNFSNTPDVIELTPNWRITPGNYMQGTCQMSAPGDCALWIFDRIPDGDAAYPNDIITGNDFVPTPQLNNYCTLYVDYLTHNWFGTTDAEKIERCNHLFDFTGYVP